MDARKTLYRKYFPNSHISDANLTILLNSLAKYYPGKDLKVVFLEIQQDNVFWSNFKAKYPHADISKFHLDNTDGIRNIYYGNYWAWGETMHDSSVFSKGEINALGRMSTFPKELVLSQNRYPVPGVSFSESTSDIADELVNLNIYVTPTGSFQAKMRNIFKETIIRFTSGAQAHAWLNEPNYKYWPQQLNFAVWCATCGCGISLEEMNRWPLIIQGFLKFHVYFTVRRILYELGVPLPDETAFDQTNNTYTKSAFEALCNEFGVVSADFRFKRGRNHGMGDVYIHYSGESKLYDIDQYSKESYWPRSVYLFSEYHSEFAAENYVKLVGTLRERFFFFFPKVK